MANGTATATTPRKRKARGTGTQEPNISERFRTLLNRNPTWLGLTGAGSNAPILQQYQQEFGKLSEEELKRITGTLNNVKTSMKEAIKTAAERSRGGVSFTADQSTGAQTSVGYQVPGAMPGLPAVPVGCQLVFLPGVSMGHGAKIEQTPQGLAIIFVPATGTAATV